MAIWKAKSTPGQKPQRTDASGEARRVWRRAWILAASATLVFALACGFIWRSVDQVRRSNAFLAEASPLLGDIGELQAMVRAEAIRLAYLPGYAETDAHADALRRMRARRHRVAERAAALDLVTGVNGGAGAAPVTAPAPAPLAARLWWREGGGGAGAEVARLVEATAAIGRSLAPDAGTTTALGIAADRLDAAEPTSLGARLTAVAEEGRLIAARLAEAQGGAIAQAGTMFLAALGAYAALMFLLVLRPLALTAALREAEAAEARLDAGETARIRQDFIHSISGELRAPVDDVIEAADAIGAAGLGAGPRSELKRLRGAAESLRSRIDDVIDLAKVGRSRAGGAENALEIAARVNDTREIDLAEHAAETARLVAARAAAKGLDLAVSVDPALPRTAELDGAALRKALLALLDNAVKYTESGGVALEIAPLGARPGPTGETLTALRYRVSDSGAGIASENRERIFEPFTRAVADSAGAPEGAGLGLAIARDLIQAMGGEITVESVPGAGSVFSIEIAAPARADSAEQEDGAKSDPGAKPDAGAPRRPLAGVSALMIDRRSPASAARLGHLRALGAEIALFDSLPAAFASLGFEGADGESARRAPLVLIRDGVVDPAGEDAAALERGRAAGRIAASLRIATRRDGETLANAAALDSLDPRGWAETIQDMRLAPRSASRETASESEPSHGGGRTAARVLVVDDEAGNRRILSLAFSRAGFLVDEARGGLEAVEKAAQTDYALATLDWRMDDIDGLETARRIRALENPSHTAALMLVTAEPQSIDRAAAEALDIAAILGKPVNLSALLSLATQLRDPSAAAA